jgi:GntR family transcriptional regulator, rspAB operon transcriptional repressor
MTRHRLVRTHRSDHTDVMSPSDAPVNAPVMPGSDRNQRADRPPDRSLPDAQSPRAIHACLRRDIVTLRLRPGERLSENDLAARFGTSRAPVREALIRLVDDGLIDVRPQRGSFVSRISLKAMERARFVREALEAAICIRAAERGITRATHLQLEATIESQIEAGENPDLFTELDDLFHRGFAEAVDLVSVWDVIEREKAQFDRVRFLSLPNTTPVAVLIDQHKAILRGVVSRQPDAAERAVRLHLSEVLRIVNNLAHRHPDLIDPFD